MTDPARIRHVVETAVVALPTWAADCTSDPTVYAVWLARLGTQMVRAQDCTVVGPIDQLWRITCDPDALAAWDIPHMCADCLDGQLQGITFLRAHPGRHVAYARLTYDVAEAPAHTPAEHLRNT